MTDRGCGRFWPQPLSVQQFPEVSEEVGFLGDFSSKCLAFCGLRDGLGILQKGSDRVEGIAVPGR